MIVPSRRPRRGRLHARHFSSRAMYRRAASGKCPAAGAAHDVQPGTIVDRFPRAAARDRMEIPSCPGPACMRCRCHLFQSVEHVELGEGEREAVDPDGVARTRRHTIAAARAPGDRVPHSLPLSRSRFISNNSVGSGPSPTRAVCLGHAQQCRWARRDAEPCTAADGFDGHAGRCRDRYRAGFPERLRRGSTGRRASPG